MAKYTVNFSCGHTKTIDLGGKGAEREAKIAYYEKYGECKECYAAKKAAALENNFDIVEMHYSEYKNNHNDCKTVADSYNAETKTIKVYVPKKTPVDLAAEEIVNMIIDMENKGIAPNDKEAAAKLHIRTQEIADVTGIAYVEIAGRAMAIYRRIRK